MTTANGMMHARSLSETFSRSFLLRSYYAQEIFEGLKAYRADDGRILMFRAKDNAQRLNNSARRLCMPEIDIDFNYEAMRQLVQVERDWVPHSAGTSLYLRPTMIAVDEALGVHAAHSYLYYIICAPSGAYYKAGLAPIRIRVEDKYVRAVRGGTGSAKTGGNYAAPSLQVQRPKRKATARFCGWTASISSTFRKSAQ